MQLLTSSPLPLASCLSDFSSDSVLAWEAFRNNVKMVFALYTELTPLL